MVGNQDRQAPHIQMATCCCRDEMSASEHTVPRCNASIWIAEREWWDFVELLPEASRYSKSAVHRDEPYIKTLIALAVELFNVELQQTVEYIRQYGARAA
jgi:hypothetical protein